MSIVQIPKSYTKILSGTTPTTHSHAEVIATHSLGNRTVNHHDGDHVKCIFNRLNIYLLGVVFGFGDFVKLLNFHVFSVPPTHMLPF